MDLVKGADTFEVISASAAEALKAASAKSGAVPEVVLGSAADLGDRGCYLCGRTDMVKQWCSRCQTACYCGPDCQRSDWRRHKVTCDEIAKAAAPPGGEKKEKKEKKTTTKPAKEEPLKVADFIPKDLRQQTVTPAPDIRLNLPERKPKAGPNLRQLLELWDRKEPDCFLCDNLVPLHALSYAESTVVDFAAGYRSCCGAVWCAECAADFAEDKCPHCGDPRATSHMEDLARLQRRRDSQTPVSDRSDDACFVLGAVLLTGNLGAGASLETAAQMFREAAETDEPRALYALAHLAAPEDEERAALLRRAAILGHVRALYDYALVLAPKDPAEARRLLYMAHEAGFPQAGAALADLIPKTPPTATIAASAGRNNPSAEKEPVLEMLD